MDRDSQVRSRFLTFLSTVALAAIFVVGLAWAGVNEGLLAACAAFASNGSSVTATTDAANLSAEITDPAGTVSRLKLPLIYPATDKERASGQRYSCKAYFDRDSDLVAIGVSYGVPARFSLTVGVADAKKANWIGKWTVGISLWSNCTRFNCWAFFRERVQNPGHHAQLTTARDTWSRSSFAEITGNARS